MTLYSSIQPSAAPSPHLAGLNTSPPPLPAPSNIDIEAVIQAATSSSNAHSPPTRDTRTQLFVGNLPYRVRWQDLKDLFRKAGTVLRADVSLGPDNRSRGYGTVLLASAEDASKAIDMFNGFSWQTRTLEVRSDRLPPDLDLSNPMNSLQFTKNHSTMGTYPVPFIPPINGAFVQADPAPVTNLRANGPLSASPVQPVPSAHSILQSTSAANSPGLGRNIFVGNLPFHCQWQDLKDLFRSAGQIVRADVALGSDGRSRGFGTVLFANDADATNAVALFNGYEYNGRILKVHHDKFSQSDSTLQALSTFAHHQPATPLAGPHTPMQVIPQGFLVSPIGSGPSAYFAVASQPGTPYDQYPPTLSRPPPPHDFPHTPGHHPSHVQQHLQYLQHLQASLPTPPPLRPPPARAQKNGSHNSTQSVGSATHDDSKVTSSDKLATSSDPEHKSISAAPPSSSRSPPGIIDLPSQPFTIPNPMSPHLTRGLPPMTPSMPGFTFHAPAVSTPPLAPHFLSPGLGPFSPPVTFFNPFLNAAPGAPIHLQSQQPPSMHIAYEGGLHSYGIPTPQPQVQPSQGYFASTLPGTQHGGKNDMGYFPAMLSGSEPRDYFSGMDPSAVNAAGTDSQTTSSRSGGTVASSQTSSPRGGARDLSSSRGTSIPAECDNEDEKEGAFDLSQQSHALASLGPRAKSSSPPDGMDSILQTAANRTAAVEAAISNGGSARRASWTDVGAMRRAIAELTLANKGK